jgi:hypothetical protein
LQSLHRIDACSDHGGATTIAAMALTVERFSSNVDSIAAPVTPLCLTTNKSQNKRRVQATSLVNPLREQHPPLKNILFYS